MVFFIQCQVRQHSNPEFVQTGLRWGPALTKESDIPWRLNPKQINNIQLRNKNASLFAQHSLSNMLVSDDTGEKGPH